MNAFDEYAYNNRGLAQWALQQFPAAEASFRKQIEVTPLDRFAHLNLGRLLLERKRPAEAVGVLEKAVSVKADDAWARLALGRAHAEAGRGPEALASFKKAVEMSPGPGIWNDVAWWMAENNLELPLALDHARSAVGAASAAVNTASIEAPTVRQIGQTSSLAAYWDTLGWVHFKLAQFDDAFRYLRAAWQVRQVAVVGEHLGKTYEKLGRPRQAFVVYRTALGLDTPSDWLRDRVRHLAETLKPAPNTADSQRLATEARTVALRALPGVREPRDVVLVVGADGSIVAARMVPAAAPEIEKALSRMRVPIDAPDTVPFKLVMRAAVACRDGGPACTMVIYRPEDAARQGGQDVTP